jgi:DNA-binding NarL/FixJ family response regulator
MQRHYRAIVADDDRDVRTLARRSLEKSGRFTVVAEASSGEEAVLAASDHQPDLTLLDLVMPDTDGLAALPRIRRAAPAGTVVVLSGMQHPHIKEDVIAAGGAGFLEKQASWSALVDDLLSLIESSPVDHTARPVLEEEQQLPAELTSGYAARQFLRDTLAKWEVQYLLDDAELLTTELVNNAVVHATSHVQLGVVLDRHRLRVQVVDTGAGALHRRQAELTDDSGRGLFLVEELSHRWGTSAGANGKTVWFELDAVEPGAHRA